jgi:hypothetical protein
MRIYLLASFPSLSLHESAPLSFEEFLVRCSAHLSASDLQELDAICDDHTAGTSSFAKEWQEASAEFNDINFRERIQRLPSESPAEKMLPSAGRHDQLRRDTEAAWETVNPLRREEALLLAKWKWLEDRRRINPYSLDDLLGYALQLQLLERKSRWDEASGLIQFQEHTQAFLEPVLEELRKQELSV